MTISNEEFLTLAEDFERISPTKAEQLISADGDVIVFVARETCPYCRIFIPKLHQVVQEHNLDVYFIHSQDESYLAEITEFREKYKMPTVPSLLYKNAESTKVVSDSSLSEEEISSFINVT